MVAFIIRQIYKYKTFVKYIISGGLAGGTDLILLFVFTDIFGIWYLSSAVLAFVVAFFVSFFLQKFWTFRDNNREKMFGQMKLYLIVCVINLVVNTAGMYILVDKVKIMYILAQIIMSGFIAISSFIIYRFFIFKRKKISLPNGENKKLKILIATGIYPPDIGGPATYAKKLSAELVKLGHEIKIISYGEPSSQANNKNLYLISRQSNIIFRYFKYYYKAYQLSGQVNLVYILDLMSAGLPATMAAKFKSRRVVFRTGGDFLWEKAFQGGWTELPLRKYYESKHSGKEKFLLNLCRWLLNKIDLILFSSQLQAEIYRKHYGLPGQKTIIISNASPALSEVKPDNSYNNSVVYAGRLVKLKNLERLINVFAEINNQQTKLLIFGEGPEENKLKTLIKKLKADDKIIIKEKVGHKKLLEIISGSKFFILPSVTEISPNLTLECVGLSQPIILTKETGLENDLMNNLIKINPLSEDDIRDKINFLLESDNLIKYRQELKNLKVKQRGWKDIAIEHISAFNNILR